MFSSPSQGCLAALITVARAASTAKGTVLLQQDSALRAVEAFPWALLETQLGLGGGHLSGWEMGP